MAERIPFHPPSGIPFGALDVILTNHFLQQYFSKIYGARDIPTKQGVHIGIFARDIPQATQWPIRAF